VVLTGPGGLLKALTKTVIETALEEMAEHLGYDKSTIRSVGTAATPLRERAQSGTPRIRRSEVDSAIHPRSPALSRRS
jgi:transposase-like protein